MRVRWAGRGGGVVCLCVRVPPPPLSAAPRAKIEGSGVYKDIGFTTKLVVRPPTKPAPPGENRGGDLLRGGGYYKQTWCTLHTVPAPYPGGEEKPVAAANHAPHQGPKGCQRRFPRRPPPPRDRKRCVSRKRLARGCHLIF